MLCCYLIAWPPTSKFMKREDRTNVNVMHMPENKLIEMPVSQHLPLYLDNKIYQIATDFKIHLKTKCLKTIIYLPCPNNFPIVKSLYLILTSSGLICILLGRKTEVCCLTFSAVSAFKVSSCSSTPTKKEIKNKNDC